MDKVYRLRNKNTKRFWSNKFYTIRPSLKWPGSDPDNWEVVSYPLGAEKLDPAPIKKRNLTNNFYQFRYKPTGEFFARNSGMVKKRGKVYTSPPSWSNIQYARDNNPANWEIVIYKKQEVGTIQHG